MPQKSGFFDTTVDDPREYPAREFAEYFARFVGNGVFGGGEKLKVTATGADANVSINLGYGWINGYMYSVYDAPLVLPIQPATTQDRIDRIVLRLDVSTPVRSIQALVMQGNPAGTPQPPSIVRSGDIFDLSLAQVLVKANTTTIQPHQITDERLNSQVCGIVTALITQADTTSIFNEFQSWLRTKTAEYQKQWDDFIKDIQDEGFATTQYVDQTAQAKANQAETNAKAASLPLTGGSVSGDVIVRGVNLVPEIQNLKTSGNNAKQAVVDAIIAKGGQASTADSWAVLAQKIRNIQQGLPHTYIHMYRDFTRLQPQSGTGINVYRIAPGFIRVPDNDRCTVNEYTNVITLSSGWYSQMGEVQVMTQDKVNLTHASRILFHIGINNLPPAGRCTLIAGLSQTFASQGYTHKKEFLNVNLSSDSSGDGWPYVIEFDVSNQTGLHHIGFTLVNEVSQNRSAITIKAVEILQNK